MYALARSGHVGRAKTPKGPTDMTATYTNPVYPGYFADPFVLRVGDDYFAYGSGSVVGDLVFEVLHSTDLVQWRSVGGALKPLADPEATTYWAPEVAVRDGQFFLYYSVGQEDRNHVIRVAVADRPEGPFIDCDVALTRQERFAIDASPFRDPNGDWYLFYARDVLEGERVGTSLAVDRLLDMTRLEGNPRTVLRATADWQLFRGQREMYGNVYDWYTLEGPFVRFFNGRYYCFYSGGAWEEENYGVSFGVADHPLGPWTEGDAARGPAILRTVPGRVLGPGHNSAVEGPAGSEYIVYHAWDPARTARRMCIDRLTWTPDGPTCDGPTFSQQPAPLR